MNVDDEPFFITNHLALALDDNLLLSDIDFSLRRGEIGCLLGPSGCGKTTLLRAIAGFETVAEGSIWLDGRQLCDAKHSIAAERRSIGMVFQDYALFPHLSALKNVQFGLHRLSKQASKKTAQRWLEYVGLTGKENAMPHALSGGEQQRVALARALAPQPELVLLDEPFSNLDIELRESLSREVRDIFKRNNTTALMVTHDQHEAFAVADKIGVLHNSRLEQWGSAYDVYHEPATRFVADFVGQGVFLKGQRLSAKKVATTLGDFNFSCECSKTTDNDCSSKYVDVLLRPDDVIHDDHSALKARVTNKYFRGAEFLYTLGLDNGEQVLALVPSHHDHEVGEKIGIRLEVDHVVVFHR